MNRWSLVPALALLALVSLGCPQTGVVCSSSEVRCGATCANLQVDPAHCGTCGTACGTGFQCTAGVCACPAGLTACGQACVDLRSSLQHCGACETACTGSQVCQAGACAASCGLGETVCGGGCVDVQSDRLHCGGCADDGGAGAACGQGTSCQSGACVSDLYAACFNSGEVFALDAESGAISPDKAVAPPTLPAGLALHGASGLEVADTGTNTLYSFDVSSGLGAAPATDAIGTGANAVTVEGDRAYVLNSTDNTLDVIDLSQPAGSASRRVCPAAHPGCAATVAFAPGSDPLYAFVTADSVYVSLNGIDATDHDTAGNKLARVSLSDWSVHATAIPETNLQATDTQARPQGIYVSGSTLYVALANLHGYDATGPGLVAVYGIPADPSADLTFQKMIALGSACVNAGGVVASPDHRLFVACGPRFDPVTYQAVQAGAVAAIDLASGTAAFAPQPLTCPAGSTGCKLGGGSRVAYAAGKVFMGDSIDGRIFEIDPATGAVLKGPASAVSPCPAPSYPDGGAGFNFISDLVGRVSTTASSTGSSSTSSSSSASSSAGSTSTGSSSSSSSTGSTGSTSSSSSSSTGSTGSTSSSSSSSTGSTGSTSSSSSGSTSTSSTGSSSGSTTA